MIYEAKDAGAEALATVILDAGLKVHRSPGPGLLESAYDHCFSHERRRQGVPLARQVPLPTTYDDMTRDVCYRIDLMVDRAIIAGVESVEALTRGHFARPLTCLKLSGCKIDFLMNFNVALFKQGVRRVVL